VGLLDFLKLPEAGTIQDLDSPEATLLHRRIIQSKPFLKSLYGDFYQTLICEIPDGASKLCVELGSGGGFIKEIYPQIVTSDLLPLEGVDRCFSVMEMPFEAGTVDAFLMIDVFHHIPDSELFLKEMNRCLKPGGRIVMIEPANTFWGRFIYQNFHHEPFDPEAGWKFEPGGPLSSANGALPWIIFSRDRKQFKTKFPSLEIKKFQAHTPLRYLISGGGSMKQLLPSFSYPVIKTLEWCAAPLNAFLGMFYFIVLQKNENSGQ